jgi:hypothetical protein
VGPYVATISRYLRGLCLDIRWKVLDIAIDEVSGALYMLEALLAMQNDVWLP